MKLSVYKSIIPITEKSCLLYSAVSDKFILCRKELCMLLHKPLLDIKNMQPVFYKQLLEGGFLVDDFVDEVKQIVDYGLKKCTEKSEYYLIINPTMNCNFKCWYCYEAHSGYTKMSSETLKKVLRLIDRLYNSELINKIHLSFFGGEPLLYYNDTVRPIIDAIREHKHKSDFCYDIHFTTNGYLINDHVLKHLSEGSEPISFQITLDGHRDKHNKVRFSAIGIGSYDKIIMNIKKLLECQIEVLLRINFTTENIDSVRFILDDFQNLTKEAHKYLRIDFQKVWQDNTIKQDDYILNKTIDLFKERFIYVTDYYNGLDALRAPCYGDLVNESVINYNGDVYKCTARDFTSINKLGELTENGEIQWMNPDFIEQRIRDKFNKKICNQCRIFPLCGGGCVQTALESINSCISCKSDKEKDNIILTRFYNRIVKYQQQNEDTAL